ncbi:MAG: type II toxin-antitoxin system HicA family toxin [Nostoc sp. CreGUA01]
MPKKIRELKAMLLKAGFTYRSGKGSHTVWSGSWQLLVILVGARQKAEGRGQKEEEENYKFKL